MINVYDIELSKINGTRRLIFEEIIKRKWRAEVPYITSPHIFIDRGDGKTVHIFSASPPANSFAAGHLANDKYATSEVLSSAGVHQLRTLLVSGESDDEAFLRENKIIVAKPLDGGHGKGITTHIRTEEQLQRAILFAREHSKSKNVILQQQFSADKPKDIRVTVINGQAVAAVMRVPARITGDGVHTVRQCIEIENSSPDRGTPYYAKLSTINVDRAAAFLGDRIDTIAKKGEEVTVLGIANYGAGGELVDVTDDMPQWMAAEAALAASAIGLAVAGVDYMIDGSLYVGMPQSIETGVIIEVNKCPALSMHDAPTVGLPRGVVAKYVDYLASI